MRKVFLRGHHKVLTSTEKQAVKQQLRWEAINKYKSKNTANELTSTSKFDQFCQHNFVHHKHRLPTVFCNYFVPVSNKPISINHSFNNDVHRDKTRSKYDYIDTVSRPRMVKNLYSSRVFSYGICYQIVWSELYAGVCLNAVWRDI